MHKIERLQKYFSQFGQVTSAVVMRDTLTKRSRGFGFVSFKDNAAADKAMECTEHVINDRRVCRIAEFACLWRFFRLA